MSDPLERAEALFDAGEELAEQQQDGEALMRFRAAWDALPEPKCEQDLAIPILGALADCHFFLEEWEGCHDAVQQAFRCGAELDNIFLRLRIGQSLYELGNETEAANWLVPVYLMEGRQPFEGEDPKYLEFFHGKLDPPEGGWPEGW